MMRAIFLALLLATSPSAFASSPCESKLEAPAMALVRIIEMAVERKLLAPEQVEKAFADGRFTNPFTGSVQTQFRRAFAAWEDKLSDQQKQMFRERISDFLGSKVAQARVSERASTATAGIINPKVIDRTDEIGLGEYSIIWLDGRPLILDYVNTQSHPRLMLFDPFSPDPSTRQRYLPPINFAGSAVLPAVFQWQGRDYIILSKEKKIFDLHTLEDVSEKFGAQRLSREENVAIATVVINRADGPYSITSMWYVSTGGASRYRLVSVPLAHPEKPNETLFGADIGPERIEWLKKFNLNGREIVAARLEARIIVWDGNTGQRLPDIVTDKRQREAEFFIYEGRMACAYVMYDQQGKHGIRIVDLEAGRELKLIAELPHGVIAITESRRQQWLMLREARGFMAVNLENDQRREILGGDPGNLKAIFMLEGDEYFLTNQKEPSALLIANPLEGKTQVHALEAPIWKLQTFSYNREPYALVQFEGQRVPSVIKILNPP